MCDENKILSNDLPNKPKPQVNVRQETETIKGTTEQHRKLEEIAERVKPDRADLKWAASFCVHVYGEDIGMGFVTVVMQAWGSEGNKIPDIVASKACQELSIAVAKKYGWEPKSKKERGMRKDIIR